MKTVLVVFTNSRLSDTSKMKRYTFNTSEDLKKGDLIESSTYDTKMQIVEVLKEKFNYVNTKTGDLTTTLNSTSCFPIRDLVQREEGDVDVIYFNIVEGEQ